MDLQKRLHPKWRARMTAMQRPRTLAQRCCRELAARSASSLASTGRARVIRLGPASSPDGPRTSPFQAQPFQEAH